MMDDKLNAGETGAEAVDESPAIRVALDPLSPSVRSIARLVIVTLLLLLVASWIQSVIYSIASLCFLVVLAVFFAYILDPLVQLVRKPFEQRNKPNWMPRPLAILIAYVIVFLGIGIAIANIAPIVSEQGKEFGANLPALTSSVRAKVTDIGQRFNRLRLPDEVQGELNKRVTDVGSDITSSIGNTLLAFVSYLPWLVLIPILGFFFLKDVNQFRLGILRMFPVGRWRYRAELVMADLNTTLAAYTRAQLISSLIVATLVSVGLAIIGLKYALLLGILAGVFEFVPLLGPLVIAIVITLTAAVSDHPWRALYAAVFLVVLRLTQDYFTYPRIVRGGLHLHPVAIILAVLAGEQVAGIPGVFLSIPIVAVAGVFYRHILEHAGRQRGLVSGLIQEAEARKDEAAVPGTPTSPTTA